MQTFNDMLDAAILSVPACGEVVEDTKRFTYLGSDMHVLTCCEPEVSRYLGRAWRVMDSRVCGAASTCVGGRKSWLKVLVFKSLVLPVLLYRCETWILTRDLRRKLNSFGARSLQGIFCSQW